jgi:hypothetical protein
MTTINHGVNEMIQTEEDIYNVIVDLKALLEHYVSGRAGNSSTRDHQRSEPTSTKTQRVKEN